MPLAMYVDGKAVVLVAVILIVLKLFGAFKDPERDEGEDE